MCVVLFLFTAIGIKPFSLGNFCDVEAIHVKPLNVAFCIVTIKQSFLLILPCCSNTCLSCITYLIFVIFLYIGIGGSRLFYGLLRIPLP